MKKVSYVFLLFAIFSAHGQEKHDIDVYVDKLKEHRSFEDVHINPRYESDYFLCPSSYIYQEMHTALIQFAKNPNSEFISPWQSYAKVEWEDGKEKPEYNIIKESHEKQDGSQGRKLEEVKHNAKPQDIEEIAQILPEDIDYKTNIYIDGEAIILEEDFSAYYEKEDQNKIENGGQVFRNLVASFPENCEITVLNKTRTNWRLDALNHQINLRKLHEDRAEIEFYSPAAKQKEIKNQAYEIIALDKKGRRLKLIYDYKIPLSVKNSFNKAGTDILPKAKQNLISQSQEQLWEKGEYHLIKAEGIIDSIYFKSLNGETQATASVSMEDISSQEASVTFLSENPYYSPVAYTLADAKSNTDIIAHEEYYEIDLPASLNSFYAYVQLEGDEIIVSQDDKILIPKDKIADIKPRLYYPLQMNIRLFDKKGEDFTLSEDGKKLQFIPKELNISAEPRYYERENRLSYPYRVYNKNGHMLNIFDVVYDIDQCNYRQAKILQKEAKMKQEDAEAKVIIVEQELLEAEVSVELTKAEQGDVEKSLSQVVKNKEDIIQKQKEAENQMKEAKDKVSKAIDEAEKKLAQWQELQKSEAPDEQEKLALAQLEWEEAKEELPRLQTVALSLQKELIAIVEKQNKAIKEEEKLSLRRQELEANLLEKQSVLKQKNEMLAEQQNILKQLKKQEEETQKKLEETKDEAQHICLVTINTGEEIDWLETALPEIYEEIQLEKI